MQQLRNNFFLNTILSPKMMYDLGHNKQIRRWNTREFDYTSLKTKTWDSEIISLVAKIHENYEYIPIRANYILQLHRDLYKYTEKSIGGQFKISQNVIAATDEDGKEYVFFTPLAPYETPSAIEDICESYNRMIENESFAYGITLIQKRLCCR